MFFPTLKNIDRIEHKDAKLREPLKRNNNSNEENSNMEKSQNSKFPVKLSGQCRRTVVNNDLFSKISNQKSESLNHYSAFIHILPAFIQAIFDKSSTVENLRPTCVLEQENISQGKLKHGPNLYDSHLMKNSKFPTKLNSSNWQFHKSHSRKQTNYMQNSVPDNDNNLFSKISQHFDDSNVEYFNTENDDCYMKTRAEVVNVEKSTENSIHVIFENELSVIMNENDNNYSQTNESIIIIPKTTSVGSVHSENINFVLSEKNGSSDNIIKCLSQESTNRNDEKISVLFMKNNGRKNEYRKRWSALKVMKFLNIENEDVFSGQMSEFEDDVLDFLNSSIENIVSKYSSKMMKSPENHIFLRVPTEDLLIPRFSQIKSDIKWSTEKKIKKYLAQWS